MNHRIRVGLVTSCIDNRPARGTALVARRFLERLDRGSSAFDFTLIHHEKTSDPLYTQWPEMRFPQTKWPVGRTMINESLFWIHEWMRGNRFDIVHYLQPRVWPSYLLTNSRKIVVTPHEAGIMKSLHAIGAGERAFQITNRWMHGRMDALLAVSAYGKREIASTYHIPESRIHVIPNGVDPQYRPLTDRAAAIATLQHEYALPSAYLLCVSRLDPHKNILRLLEAYATLRTQHNVQLPLVLVGGDHLPEYSQQVTKCIEQLHLTSHVIRAPFIKDEHMPLVYGCAELLVFPSLHEGFGLPILEAFACHTPVVASAIPAFHEVADDAALFVDPTSTQSIIDGILSSLHDDAPRASRVQRGAARAKDYSWDNAADTIFALYHSLLA
ncbi:MAG: glycosyltransferase family 1 protein [Patescibacteria group bacterium]